MTDSTGIHIYRDALHLADDHTFTEEEIQTMKQARFDNWLAIILSPVVTSVEETVTALPNEEPIVENAGI